MVRISETCQKPSKSKEETTHRRYLRFFEAAIGRAERRKYWYFINDSAKHFNPEGIEIYDSKKVTKEYLQNQLFSLLSLPDRHLTKE